MSILGTKIQESPEKIQGLAVSGPEISVVAAMHNEEDNVLPLYQALEETLGKMGRDYEIIFVNDASQDRTLEEIKKVKAKNPRFRYCDLEYNAGENWAFLAGFSKARGDIIATIDGDFQNDPKFLPRLIRKIDEGYKAASGWRKNRVGGFFDRILPSVAANFLISLVSGVRIHDCGCGLRAFRREVVANKFVPRGFMNRFAPIIFGIKQHEFCEVEVEDRMRVAGKSHYGLERIFIVFNDILALPFILRGPERAIGTVKIWQSAGAGLFAVSVFGAIVYSAWWWTLVFMGLLFWAAFTSIRWNLNRFIAVKAKPEFKIKDFN